MKETVSAVRTVRKNRDIANREKIQLLIMADKNSYDTEFLPVVNKLCNLSDMIFISEKQDDVASFMVGITEYFIPVAGNFDVESEIAKIQAEMNYHRGFLANVMKKLDNERFVKNAPENVLELERKKKSDAESKIIWKNV